MRQKFPPQQVNPLAQSIAGGLQEQQIRRQLDRPDPAVTGGEVSLSPQFGGVRQGLQAAGGMLLDPRPEAQAGVIAQAYGDVEQATDRAGRPIVRRPGGEWTYVNTPGLSFQDVANVGSEIVRFGAAALPASRIGSLGLRAGATGGLAGGVQVASEAGASVLGSEAGVSVPNAMLAAAGGGVGEVAGAALSPLMRPRGNQGPGIFSQMMDMASPGAAQIRAEDAVRLNPDVSRPFGIPLTRGQITQDPRQIAFEQAAIRGGRGEQAERVMRPFAQQQAEAALEAGRGLAGPRVTQTESVRATAPEAGQRVRAGLTQAEQAAEDRIREAYGQARQYDVNIAGQAIGTLRSRLWNAIPDDIRAAEEIGLMAGREQRAPMRAILTDAENITRRAQAAIEGGAEAAEVSFRAVEAMRSALETQRRALAATAGSETAAMILTRQKSALDDWIDDTVSDGLWSGDPRFLDAFQNARRLRREFALRFEKQPNQYAQQAVRQIIDKDMNAGAVVDVIFGPGQNISNKYSAAVTENLVNILGRESAEVQALRESLVDRMIGSIEGQAVLAPARAGRNILQAIDGTPRETLNVLFAPNEITQMRRFGQLLERLSPPAGTVNTSGTAYELNRVVGGMMQNMSANPLVRMAINRVEGLAGGALNEARAVAATRGPRAVALAPRLAVALSATGAQEANRAGLEGQRLDALAASLSGQGATGPLPAR
jgi:hypothetical protein